MAVNTAVDLLTFVIKELGVFAIGATVVGWVVRGAISNYFDKELAEYQSEVDRQMERYRTELEKETLQFSELHNKRAKITAELYARFVEFEEDMVTLTSIREHPEDPPKEEQRENAAESGNEFLNYYIKNKIYFPPEVCETIEDLQSELRSVFIEFQIYRPDIDGTGDPTNTDKWEDNWKKVTEDEVSELKSELEDHFRGLLGVEFERDDDSLQKSETDTEIETAKE